MTSDRLHFQFLLLSLLFSMQCMLQDPEQTILFEKVLSVLTICILKNYFLVSHGHSDWFDYLIFHRFSLKFWREYIFFSPLRFSKIFILRSKFYVHLKVKSWKFIFGLKPSNSIFGIPFCLCAQNNLFHKIVNVFLLSPAL